MTSILVDKQLIHRGALSVWCVVIALFAATGTVEAKPGNLDLSFGRQGKTMAATGAQTTEFPELGAGIA